MLPTVKIEQFEGPFDLLLELVRARKVDLTKVSLKQITDDFLVYLEESTIPALVQADFLIVAATLLLLKLKQLLPNLTAEEEEEITELTDRVRLYQLYREQARGWLSTWNETALLPGPERLAVEQEVPYPTYHGVDLEEYMTVVINRIKTPLDKRKHLRPRGRSLADCIRLLQERLDQAQKLLFAEIVKSESRETQAVSFLALLELARRQELQLKQDGLFNPIRIERSE